jgi:hypothetical protein
MEGSRMTHPEILPLRIGRKIIRGLSQFSSSDNGTVPLGCGEAHDPLADPRAVRWVWAFLLLGVAARVIRYALRFPLWEDECFLSANLFDRGYLELLGGLNYDQVCPLLFLWVQKTMVLLLGFNEYALRLFALLTGLASLFLFSRLAGRLLKGAPWVIAVAIFAVGYPGVRYSCEAKQYCADLFFGLVLFWMAVEWQLRGHNPRWLWALAAVIPLAVGMSYPSVFVGGGVSLFVAWTLWRSRGMLRGWTPWAVYNLALLGSFGILFLLSMKNQNTQTLAYMQQYWKNGFPPLTEPLALIRWLVLVHTSDMLAYPFGANNGGSALTFLCCMVGAVVLARRRQGTLLLLCLAPLGLTFLAAAMHRYPYGQMVKFQIYLAPVFCLLAGLGAATLCLRGRSGRPAPSLPIHVLAALLVLFGVGSILRDFSTQAKSDSVMRARDFARWFWFTTEFDGEIACLKTDLHQAFSKKTYQSGLSSMYLCNQRIYSPRHARGAPPRFDQVSADRPLRCVEYRSVYQGKDYDEQARDAWLASMCAKFDLVSEENYPFVLTNHSGTRISELDYLHIYRFVPKSVWTANRAKSR